MDATDREIVALLRENARRSYQDIGRHVHLSAPAVKRRVDRLEAPPELVDDIWLSPGIWPNWRSSGAVIEDVVTSGLAPG